MPTRQFVNVERVKALLAKGLSRQAIAERVGCAAATVGTIAKMMKSEGAK